MELPKPESCDVMKMIKRNFKDSPNSYFLFGPRGTGKSTWLKVNHKDALTIDLLEPATFRSFKSHPERLTDIIAGNPEKNIVIIDEIQKVPELLDAVHMHMEKSPERQFILTGSSPRKIKQAGVNLLGGRALLRSLHPFMASELKEAFKLDEALRTGLIPLVVASHEPAQTLEAYILLYMREEIQMEGLVRNIGDFARFLEAISFSHGAVLNISNVGRECEVGRKTVQGFIDVLYDLLMAYPVPVFARKARRTVIRHPKFYFFDTGVFMTLRPSGPLDRPEEIHGAALEGLVAQHLRAWIAYRQSSCRLYYWRTRAGTEVDFIVYGDDGFWAIEVQNSRTVRSQDLRSLKAFCDDYPECTPLLVYRGDTQLYRDGILCAPCATFLHSIKPDQPLPMI